jgi:DNA-binding transcriptional LysR family regulator
MPSMHGFDLEDLAVFCEVVRRGSFTGAAAARHYTQSGVSRRVAALERASGGALFVRQARGVRLTPAGVALHRHAEAVLARLDAAADEVAALRRGAGGRVRLGCFATASAGLVPAAVRAQRDRSPHVEVTVREGLTPALVDGVRSGALDLAVVSDYPTGTLDASGLRLVPLGEDPLLVALSRDHPLAGGPPREPLALAALAGERWVEAGRHGDDTMLVAACRRAGFTPRVEGGVASWAGKLGFVAAGLAVTLVPRLAAGEGAVRPDVVLRPLRDDLPARRIHVALPVVPEPLSAALTLTELLEDSATAMT